MRAGQVALLLGGDPDPLQGGGIVDRLARDPLGQPGSQQCVQPLEVAGGTDIHGVRRRGHRRLEVEGRSHTPQELGEEVVTVVGRHEASYREPHLQRQNAPGEVPEIAAGNAHHQLAPLPPPQSRHLEGGPEVVERLGQKSPDVDGVGAGEPPSAEPRLGERPLDQPLAVVEGSAHREGPHPGPRGDQLSLLQFADHTLRVEQDDLELRQPGEGGGHGAAGVARGRHQHGDSLVPLEHPAHEPGHSTGPQILEGQRGPMKQLEQVAVTGERGPPAAGSRGPPRRVRGGRLPDRGRGLRP